jgi:hypothetical protein
MGARTIQPALPNRFKGKTTMHFHHCYQYWILGLLIGGLLDALIPSTETLLALAGGLAGVLAGFWLGRRKEEQ